MEKSNRMIQVYGYIICIVAVVTFLIAVGNLVYAVIDLGDPMSAVPTHIRNQPPSLASYENYKMDMLKSIQSGEGATEKPYIPDDQTLRGMYEAARNDRIQNIRHTAIRNIIVNSFLLVISIILFVTHWIWMGRVMRRAND